MDNQESHQHEIKKSATRRGIDPFLLITGIATLLVAAYISSDGILSLPNFDFRWVLAGSAILVGVLLLIASLRSDKEK